LVSGATQAGKTTVLNALVGSVSPTERVITIEEVFELKPRLPDCVAMQTRSANLDGIGEISIRRLIKEALRMRPSRLVIGEIREAESLDLLIALNSGIPGMATIHANSAREAIRKLQTLPLLAGENITQDFLTPTVYSAIDYVIHVGVDHSGTRRILEVARVSNRSENTYIEMEFEFLWDGTMYRRGPLI
jgi:pilus assembly protein CpaF